MLALAGGAAGLVLAMWGMKLLERLRPAESDYGGWPSYLRAITAVRVTGQRGPGIDSVT